jgi:hypothetical protein
MQNPNFIRSQLSGLNQCQTSIEELSLLSWRELTNNVLSYNPLLLQNNQVLVLHEGGACSMVGLLYIHSSSMSQVNAIQKLGT